MRSIAWIGIIILICIMLLGNRKVRLFSILKEQLFVFKNAKTDRLSIWDIFCFIIAPMCLGSILVFGLGQVISNEIASICISVFSVVFTILFGFAAIIVGKIESNNDIEREVVSETFISIMSATLLALIASVLSAVLLALKDILLINVISFVIYSISTMMLMLCLLVSKRTYIIFCENKKKQDD